MSFTKNISDKIKYYIYIYSDPDTNQIFYVGKGNNNRVFSHLKAEDDSEIKQKIEEIRKRGKEPRIEILLHGLKDDKTALRVESSINTGCCKPTLAKTRPWIFGVSGLVFWVSPLSHPPHPRCI